MAPQVFPGKLDIFFYFYEEKIEIVNLYRYKSHIYGLDYLYDKKMSSLIYNVKTKKKRFILHTVYLHIKRVWL